MTRRLRLKRLLCSLVGHRRVPTEEPVSGLPGRRVFTYHCGRCGLYMGMDLLVEPGPGYVRMPPDG